MNFIPGTNQYKISKSLDFAEKMSGHRYKEYVNFHQKIEECMTIGCPENANQLRNMADTVSPGLGNVDCICSMIEVVKKHFPK